MIQISYKPLVFTSCKQLKNISPKNTNKTKLPKFQMSLLRKYLQSRKERMHWRQNALKGATGQNWRDLKDKKLHAPPSTQQMLIFKLDQENNTFSTADFSIQWAEGRITLQEIKEVLNCLRSVEGFNVHQCATKKELASPRMYKLLMKRQKNFNKFLIKTDKTFKSRALRFRAGPYGAWVTLEKMSLAPAQLKNDYLALNQPQDHGFTAPMNPFGSTQNQGKEHAKQGVQYSPNPF